MNKMPKKEIPFVSFEKDVIKINGEPVMLPLFSILDDLMVSEDGNINGDSSVSGYWLEMMSPSHIKNAELELDKMKKAYDIFGGFGRYENLGEHAEMLNDASSKLKEMGLSLNNFFEIYDDDGYSNIYVSPPPSMPHLCAIALKESVQYILTPVNVSSLESSLGRAEKRLKEKEKELSSCADEKFVEKQLKGLNDKVEAIAKEIKELSNKSNANQSAFDNFLKSEKLDDIYYNQFSTPKSKKHKR